MKTQPMHPNEVNRLINWTPSFRERCQTILDNAREAAYHRRQRPVLLTKAPRGISIALLTFTLLAVASWLGACGGEGMAPVQGPLVIGIESGNHQSGRAGAATLIDPVSTRMVRAAANPALHDGTVVSGSPIPNATVCAVATSKITLQAFVPCTNTDATGHATFFFSVGTVAGDATVEIRGTLAGQPAVFDTVHATVLPTDVASLALRLSATLDLGTVAVGDTVRLDNEITKAQDTYGNLVTDWTVSWAFSTDSIVGMNVTSFPAMPNTGRKPVVPAGARALYMQVGTARVWLKLRTS